MPRPSPQPYLPEPGPAPTPVPSRRKVPAKPGVGLILGLCIAASLVTGLSILALSVGPQGPASSRAVPMARWAAAASGELRNVLRVGGIIETLDYASIRVPRLRGPRDSGRAYLTLTMVADSGATVSRGDPIADFELRWLVDHIEDRASVVVTQTSNFRKQQADIEILKETERQARVTARAEYQKAELDVRTAEVRSEIEAEILKNLAEESRATWLQLEDEGTIKERVHGANLRVGEIKVREEVLHLERHERDLTRLNVRAPIDGMVVRETLYLDSQFAQAKEGDRIYPGALFMRIVDNSQMIVNAAVNQADSQSIRIGDEAVIELDAYPGERFRGRVLDLGAVASSAPAGSPFSRGRVSAFIKHIPMRVVINDKDDRIIPDLSASVDVIAANRPTGIIVPREAVRTDPANGRLHVYVRAGEGAQRRRVTVDAMSDTEALVASGLSAGEEVLLSQLPASWSGVP